MKQTITLNRYEQEACAMFIYFFLQTVAKRNGIVPEVFETEFVKHLHLPFEECVKAMFSNLEYDGTEPIVKPEK